MTTKAVSSGIKVESQVPKVYSKVQKIRSRLLIEASIGAELWVASATAIADSSMSLQVLDGVKRYIEAAKREVASGHRGREDWEHGSCVQPGKDGQNEDRNESEAVDDAPP